MRKFRIEEIVIAVILIAGVLLSLIQFLYNRSLWTDESWLALNIINKSPLELLKPLDYGQVAPILFLQIEKLFSTLLPHSEYGLRLLPLLCFWFALYFFYQIIRMQLKHHYAIILALSFFVFNSTFIYFSSEVKQYMADIFVLLCIYYLFLKDYKKEVNRFYLLGIVGTLAIFLSNVTPLILFTCGVYLLYDDFWVTKRKRIKPLSLLFSVWVCVFVVYYYFFAYNHPTRAFMLKFWAGTNAFLPIDSLENFVSFVLVKKNMIQETLAPDIEIVVYGMLFLFLTGVIALIWKKKIQLIILTCTPVLLHLFLSVFHLYPFEKRLILYTLPCMIIIYSFGFESIIEFISVKLKIRKSRFLRLLIPVIIPAIFLVFLSDYPIKGEEVKDCLKYLEENVKEDENIYVYYFALPTYEYYKQIGYASIKEPVMKGEYNTHYAYLSGNLNEFETLHGKYWLLITAARDNDEKLITHYLDSLEYPKIKEFKTCRSSVYLYNFDK
jgi:hypothetical protein